MASAELTVLQILEGLAASEDNIEEVLFYLNASMWDEWDIDFASGLKQGWGGKELQIAAQAGLAAAKYDESNK